MKKLSILFLSVLTLGLGAVSCSSDDDNPSIEGKWEITQVGIGIVGGEEQIINPNEGSVCSGPTIEFLKDDKLITTTFNESDEGICEPQSQNGGWNQDGNNITIKFSTDSDENQKFEIQELTENKLKLYATVTVDGLTSYQYIIFNRK
ncbi:hypothetical protein AR687_18640 [Flavobacteriaceae bacterium CRH]|nr:hypothetical protein AR687_18640 [Flavobacteriaceae bacterium CRH]